MEVHNELYLNVKTDPEYSELLRKSYEYIIPAYHMNKQHWNTIIISEKTDENIVKELIEMADNNTKHEIEELIAGGTLKKPVHEDITYGDIYKTQDNLWNFLFFTGYLKSVGKSFHNDMIYLDLK